MPFFPYLEVDDYRQQLLIGPGEEDAKPGSAYTLTNLACAKMSRHKVCPERFKTQVFLLNCTLMNMIHRMNFEVNGRPFEKITDKLREFVQVL